MSRPISTAAPMTEEVIESTFTSSDWHEAFCAHCIEFGSVVSMADVPTCRGCLEKYYDADGNELPMNTFKPLPVANENLESQIVSFLYGTIAASVLALFFLAPFLMDSSDVVAFWKEIVR